MNTAIAFALAQALFHFLWQGAAAALLLALALAGTQRRSARLRYALACAAMLAMLVAFAATIAWLWPHSVSTVSSAGAAKYSVLAPPLWLGYEIRFAQQQPSILDWVAPAWLLGVLLLSLRSLAAWVAATRLKRAGTAVAPIEWQAKLVRLAEAARVSRPVAMVASCLTEIPVVVGFLKPVILVPVQLLTGFPPEQLELILLHELAHIRRHDYLVNLLQSFAEDLLFFHPAVWWVSIVIRAERENCCDDVVIASKGDARTFAEALAALEQQRWTARDAVVAANGGKLMHRIQRLLGQRPTLRLAGPAFFASLAPLAFVLATAVARAQAPAAPPPIPPPPAPRPPELTKAVQKAAYRRFLNHQVAQIINNQVDRQIREAQLKNELETPYTKWLNEEVVYIISNEEREAFRRLTTDDEREHFIEQFWLRRDPTPETLRNEYREEHYRRIAYTNEHFSTSSTSGWKTDRGMIYIKYGPPDEIDQHPSGGFYTAPDGTSKSVVHAFETWRYRYLAGIGGDVTMEFVDDAGNGSYHMTVDPNDKKDLQIVPGAAGASPDQFERLRRLASPDLPVPKH